MPSTIHRNIQFRQKIVSLLLDPFWSMKYGSLLLPEYFESDVERNTVAALQHYYEAYRKPPIDPVDVVALAGDDCEDYIFDLYDVDIYDKTLASDVVLTFVKEQRTKIAVIESVDYINKGKLDRVVELIQEAIDVDKAIPDFGYELIEDIDSWIADLWTSKISSGWSRVDACLDGGFSGGEYVIIMAPSNRGKTMSLINVGYGAATLGSGKNVAHWTGEISTSVVMKRYAARMVHRFLKRNDSKDGYKNEVLQKAKKLLPGKIRAFGGHKISIRELENQLDIMRQDGFIFDELIVDYPDLLSPTRSYSDKRHEHTDIAEGLRELAQKYGVPVIGASQSNRASFTKETLDLEDIAEDIGKANTADIVITLSQTKSEFENNRCRLHMPKIRDGKKILTPIHCKFYSDSQAIIPVNEA